MKQLLKAPIVLFLLYYFIWYVSIFNGQYYDYSLSYYLYMGSAFIFFSFSYLVAFHTIKSIPRILDKNYIDPHTVIKIYHALLFVGILCNLINYLQMVGLDAFTAGGMQLYRKKLTLNLQKPIINFAFIFNPFFLSILPMRIIFKDYFSKLDKILFPMYLIAYIYLTGSRSQLFLSIILWGFFYLIYKKHTNYFKVAIPIVSLAFSLPTLFILLGKNIGQNYASLSTLLEYLVAPSHALDIFLVNPNVEGLLLLKPGVDGFKDLFLTFRPIHFLLVQLDLILFPADLLPYVKTPVLTNVYTMFGVYVKDYGIYGSFLLVSCIGIYSGAIEKLSSLSPNNCYLKFLISLNFTCLILSAFYDYYLSAGCVWLMVIFSYFLFPKSTYTIVSAGNIGLRGKFVEGV